MDKIRVLLVEDESVLAMIIKETLDARGFEVHIAVNGVEGWASFNTQSPDLCLVDVMLPRKDGFLLVADIRKVNANIPIIFLTAKTQTEDVLKGLEIGADDYIKKPFSMEELILRLRVLMRRSIVSTPVDSKPHALITDVGSYKFDFHRLELTYNDQRINLSQREAQLMQLLLQNKNRVLDRKTALLKIWGDDSVFNSRSMDVYITRLRKHLNGDPAVEILNIRGLGYKLID